MPLNAVVNWDAITSWLPGKKNKRVEKEVKSEVLCTKIYKNYRALQRIGNAYLKLGKLDEAIKYYGKSLTEHRTPETLQKLRDTEKLKKEQEKAAYYNPELADKAREEGNALFKAAKW